VRDHFKNQKFHDAAMIIHKFQFHQEFDCFTILDKLVISNGMGIARQICELDMKYKLYLIKILTTNDTCKTAS
jgi:hypothetical protein